MSSSVSMFGRVRRSAPRFRRAEGGNVAVMFAIAIVPILAFVGAAIDYARANSARTAMQAALDSAALMLSRDAATTSSANLTQKAQNYFNALYTNRDAQNVLVSATYTTSTTAGSQLVMTASGKLTTDFMKIAGYPTLNFGASTTTVWGNTRLRVALVLDNTGSMSSSGKMDALKTAAKNLIDQLSASAKNAGDVYVSIIPFAKDVNISSVATASSPWLRWDLWEDAWQSANGTCNKKDSKNRTITNEADCVARKVGGTWTPSPLPAYSTWNGCVTDRDKDYDVKSTAPYAVMATAAASASLATQFPTEQYSACPQAITPLSYDWATLKTKIDAMQPSGNTNQGIGLAWGWLSLLQQSPLNAPAEDSNYKYSKVIILLSDGDNTENRFSTSTSTIDARQKLICDNAKAASVIIYTIQVNTNNDNTSTVMSYCASSSDNFFSTTSASGIGTAFSSIGNALSKLRLAR